MPRPRPRTAFPTAAALAAQRLSVDQVDPDYLNFLEQASSDGNSYAVELPARGVSPPVTFKNKAEMATANGEAQSSLVPSPAPAKRGRRVEQEIPPADAPQWYETATMDEDYRNFWRQMRIVEGRPVLQLGEDKVLRYELEAVAIRLSDISDWAEKNGWKEVAAVAAFGEDGKSVGVGEKDKVAPMVESRVRDSPERRQKKKVKQGQEEKGEGKCGAEKINVVNGEDNMLSVVPMETLNTVNTETTLSIYGHDAEPHIASKVKQGHEEESEGKRGSEKINVVNREDNMLSVVPMETLITVNTETHLSIYGHDAEPHIASGSYGVVWPTHIMERPESSFKKMLLRDLRRPCSLEEYQKLLRVATDHLPATKGRQLRGVVKYYNSEHEKNRSYFDSHPDLAKQVTSTSYPNKLALLRGFFFWLKNVTNEDQFRPWRDDFRQYAIIPHE